MADDLGERTEDPTPKRRQEARDEGNVAKSQDLTGALMLLVATVTLWAAAVPMIGQAKIAVGQALDVGVISRPLDPAEAGRDLAWLGTMAVRIGLPVLFITWGAALLAQIWQVGWIFSPKAVQPKLSKLSPISGFKRIFGLTALVKAGLDSAKVVVVLLVAVFTTYESVRDVVMLPYLPLLDALGWIGRLLIDVALRVTAVLLLLGLMDFLYQKWKHHEDLRMTKQQVKDEMKQSEGDPEVKKRRMRMQQQIAMQRINAAVPQADVVVTNPEHLSVAIRYDQSAMKAPRVVAKGADHLALRIRQLARQHGVPVVERKPLARALYRDVAVGQEVPPQFYQAVAEILAYVYRLSGRAAG